MNEQSVINCDLSDNQVSELSIESTLLEEKEQKEADVFDFTYVYPKCGKEFLRLCAIPTEATKRTVVHTTINPSICESSVCPVYLNVIKRSEAILNSFDKKYENENERMVVLNGIIKEQLNLTCISSDNKLCCSRGAVETKEETIYEYEFIASNGAPKRLSKIQIKLALVYHFLADNNGFISRVSDLDLAKKLKCDIKTLRAAIDVLAEMQLIAYSAIDTYNKSVCILNFKTYHLSARQGGSGYIVMAPTTLEVLLKCSDVNELRIQIRSLLIDDKHNITNDNEGKEERSSSVLSVNDAKRFAPRYLSISKVKKLFTSSALFESQEDESKVSFKLKNIFNGKRERANALASLKNAIQDMVNKYNFTLDEEECYDAAQLAKEYSLELVQEAFNNIATTISNEEVKKEGLMKELLNKYDPLVGKDSTATVIFNELVEVFESGMPVNEAAVLNDKHPEVIFKGKTAIQNFGGYLRKTIKSILYKRSSYAFS